jgi:hypothetical protein
LDGYRLHDGVGRSSIPKVEVVQRVAGVGGNTSLVVGRGAGSLGLAEGNGRKGMTSSSRASLKERAGNIVRAVSVVFVVYASDEAACLNACSSIGGNAFPLFVARLKIPAQAFAER